MSFQTATAVQAKDSHTYTANFVDDWCIGSGKGRERETVLDSRT